MLTRSLLLLCVVVAAYAATTENRVGPQFRPQKAEERDGAHHGGGHHGGGSSGGHHASSGSSSYSAPSHSAPANSYSAPHSSSSGHEQGNLYYYYYPVEEYGSTEAADGGFDVFTAIILPLLILGGLLLALSSYTFNFTTGRALGLEPTEPTMVDQLHSEVERIFYLYLNAFESESCVKRTICESGVWAKEFSNKDFLMTMADPFVPETMRGNMALFKMAAKDGFEVGKCKKYRCSAPKIFN